MIKSRFCISEIITIVMSFVENIEKTEIYGIEDEQIDLPIAIENRINNMNNKLYKDFVDKISYIAEEVYKLKTGELNQLNMIHGEIKLLALEYLKDYLIE